MHERAWTRTKNNTQHSRQANAARVQRGPRLMHKLYTQSLSESVHPQGLPTMTTMAQGHLTLSSVVGCQQWSHATPETTSA
eukprot:13824646-Alexandrium_andersonii.AAC.1